MSDLAAMSELELLRTHSAVLDELRRREVVRTRNNPVGDYTEWLVSQKMQPARTRPRERKQKTQTLLKTKDETP